MFRKYTIVIIGSILLLFSCKGEKEVKNYAGNQYFDLKTYFNQEALRLQKLNPTVSKTVIINGSAEYKSLKIKDWVQEFSIFSHADINKTARNGKFKTIKTDSSITYLSDDEKVSTKKIVINKANNQITGITIINANKNLVFTTNDTLTYIPNKLYGICKYQKIKLVKTKVYKIKAEFKTI